MSKSPKTRIKRTRDQILEMFRIYCDGATFNEVGKLYGLSGRRVSQLFTSESLDYKDNLKSKQRPKTGPVKKLDKEVLLKLYRDEEKPMLKVAKILDCTQDLVWVNLHYHGIEVRSREVANRLNSTIYHTITREKLVELAGQKLKVAEMAEIFGCSKNNIYKLLNKFGIPPPKKGTKKPDVKNLPCRTCPDKLIN